jgi:uncharacterized phage protein (TIGR01671 family)
MNRNKKFRAWDGKKMIYGTKDIIETPVVTFDGRVGWVGDVSCATDEESYNSFEENKYWEVMQYTGLKDKNGKEIYEGDIVRYTENKLFGDGENRVGIFIYDEWMARYHIEDDRGSWDHIYTWNGTQNKKGGSSIIEVIGNIYENKDINKKL